MQSGARSFIVRDVFFRSFPTLTLFLLSLGSCSLNTARPDVSLVPSSSCGDGVCDITTEDCQSCRSDCACCYAVDGRDIDDLVEAQHAIGAPDERTVMISEFSSITLTLGREVFDHIAEDDTVAVPDLRIIGSVTSEATTTLTECTNDATGSGAVEVYVSNDQAEWRLVGLWTASTNTFDLACSALRTARWIRLDGQPGTQATLDAIEALSCIDESLDGSTSTPTDAALSDSVVAHD